jgi:hypothetical protein
MDQKMHTTLSEGKKTWSSPSLKTINLNEARFGTLGGTDGSGVTKTRS